MDVSKNRGGAPKSSHFNRVFHEIFTTHFGGNTTPIFRNIHISWIYRPPSNSHHQDYSIFSRESLKTFICDCYWVGGRSNIYGGFILKSRPFFQTFTFQSLEPEPPNRRKVHKSHEDLWSLGVLTFLLLTGGYPNTA